MLPASMIAMRLRNMSVSTPAGMFIAPIAAARAPMIPPAATSLSSSVSLMWGSSSSSVCW